MNDQEIAKALSLIPFQIGHDKLEAPAREAYIEQIIFMLRVNGPRTPELFRVLDLLEGLASKIGQTDSVADDAINELFDKYAAPALAGALAGMLSAGISPSNAAGSATLAVTEMLELRKKVLDGHREQGSVSDGDGRGERGDQEEIRPSRRRGE